MDIWKWVFETEQQLRDAGNHRLADLIMELPTNASRGRTELAEAALPEALAGARAAGLPWLEVYFRHWVINRRVSVAKEGEAALKETVALFELAHRPETVNCPQSVCTTQDIACCYANVDGPGFAHDRIAVCRDTLDRIDNSWGCFRCISVEMMSALVDAGQPREALAFAQQQLPLLQETGADETEDWHMALAQAQFAAGELETALATLEFADRQDFDGDTPAQRYARACQRFHLLALLGRVDDAWAALPPEEQGREFGEHFDLAAGLEALLKTAPERNDVQLGRRTAAALRRYSAAGSHRLALEALAPHVRLAVARGARWAAARALEIARPHLAKLKQPLGAPEAFAALEAIVAAMPAPLPPVPPAQLAGYLREHGGANPEQEMEWLLAAAEHLPQDAELALLAAQAMRACGEDDAATGALWRFVLSHPEAALVADELLSVLVGARDERGVQELAGVLRETDPGRSSWCLARLAFAMERWQDVGTHAARMLEHDPAAVAPRALWADAAMRAGDYEQALTLQERLAEEETKAGKAHWAALVAASALLRWDRVRALAPALGMHLAPGEGAIDQQWEQVRIQRREAGGMAEYLARRTGPATARVVSLADSGELQVVDELVVFDPLSSDAVPGAEEDAGQSPPLYHAIATLEPSRYGPSYLIDGAKPDNDAVSALTSALDARGWQWSVRSDDDYTVVDTQADTELAGMRLLLAAPADTPAADIAKTLRELTAGYTHPLCWYALAEEADADVEHHGEVMGRYELWRLF